MPDGYETHDFSVRSVNDVTVVRLKDENLTGVRETMRIGDELGKMVLAGVRKLVLDLKHIRYCGSVGLGMLIGINNRMRDAGGQFVISHAEHITQLLEVSRTTKLFRIAPDPKEALTMFK
jgi:anti-anti-sigma factor